VVLDVSCDPWAKIIHSTRDDSDQAISVRKGEHPTHCTPRVLRCSLTTAEPAAFGVDLSSGAKGKILPGGGVFGPVRSMLVSAMKSL
jgi:hypothetical protein